MKSNPGLCLHIDEGKFVRVGCLDCREDVIARIVMATPVRAYVAALECQQCGSTIVALDLLTERTAA